MRKKVIVAMSGGVDSSVAALLMKLKGYDCEGIYLRFWSDPKIRNDEKGLKFPENKCCSDESLERARRVAAKLEIPFYVKDIQSVFKEKIVDYFLKEHREAKTPNPCIECNRNVKFGILLGKALELGADYLVTGHYARIRESNGNFELLMGKDREKDQSYFLYTLSQEKLQHILLPIGEYSKTEVRKMAGEYGLDIVREQKESQGICFFPDKKHTDFLKRHLETTDYAKGAIVDSEGNVVGEHEGLPLYTVGQRKGLQIGGEKKPWYVKYLDHERNELIVGKEEDLFESEIMAEKLNFIGPKPVATLEVFARVRHRYFPEKAKLTLVDEKAIITFGSPQRAVAKGQSVVFYTPDGEKNIPEKMLGGGIIV